MARNDAATLIIDTGHYFTATVGTALPTNLLSPEVAWDEIGNTSLEDIFALSSEGGDQTVIGTLQNKSLRTKYSARTESFTINLQQFDSAALKLYYGSNMVDVNSDGKLLGVPQSPTPTTKAFLAIFIDGENHFAFYAPKAEIFRGDDAEFSNTEDVASLPLKITPLINGSNTWAFAVTPLAVNEDSSSS